MIRWYKFKIMGERERRPRGNDLPELPLGMTIEDLRFVNPHIYPIDMASKGWQVLLERDVDGNPAKVAYSLERGVPEDIDVEALQRKIGILDEDGFYLPGYYLGVAHSKDAEKFLARKVGLPSMDVADNEGNSQMWNSPETSFLLFNFRGFPTAKTMDVLLKLENEFLADGPKPPRGFRLVAEVEIGPRGTIFERIKRKITGR